ncbi:MAG: hypothetical protein AABX99_01680 [Nanoarchaeota archaeon]
MKKGKIILIIFLSLVVIFSIIISVDITGRIITGKSLQYFGMNITIISSDPPALTLSNPKNQTYMNNKSILLNYSASGQQAVWYSLDSGDNITITSSTHFNASDGSHTLFLYTNNSNGETSQNVTFLINPDKYSFNYDEWEDDEREGSTNFSEYSYEDLQNLSDLTFEDTTHGKIKFNENVNLTGNNVNLSYVNISWNRIEINSTALPDLNKSAALQLSGLTFSNPRILRDGAVCSSEICTHQSYAGGILKFNVTGFSIYSSEEAPTTATATTSSSSGGGGGGSGGNSIIDFPPESFSLSLEQINIKIEQGQVKTQEVAITNNQNSDLTVEITTSKISDFLIIKEPKFILKKGESKILKFEVLALKENTPELYLGEIIFKAGIKVKKILAAIEVESANPLFDVSAEISPQFLWVVPGKELYSKINMYNLGESGKAVDVNIEYRITDSKGNEILHSTEEVAVNTKLSFVKEFIIPPGTKLGQYVLYIKITYTDLVASASVWFNVGTQTRTPIGWPTLIGIAALIGAIIANVWNFRKIKKDKNTYRIDESNLKETGMIKK